MLIQFQPPATCRVANQQTWLPRATSSLALNASRDGASTASLGNLFSASPPSGWKPFIQYLYCNSGCCGTSSFQWTTCNSRAKRKQERRKERVSASAFQRKMLLRRSQKHLFSHIPSTEYNLTFNFHCPNDVILSHIIVKLSWAQVYCIWSLNDFQGKKRCSIAYSAASIETLQEFRRSNCPNLFVTLSSS